MSKYRLLCLHLVSYFCFICVVFPSLALSQEKTPDAAKAEQEVISALSDKKASLEEILITIRESEREIAELQSELRSAGAKGREEEILASIKSSSAELSKLRASFEQIATGVDARMLYGSSQDEAISWSQELHSLLLPLLGEIKQLTTRPREIDEYRRRIDSLSQKQQSIEWGVKNIDSLLAVAKEKKLVKKLTAVKEDLLEKRQETNTQLAIARGKLDQILGDKRDILDSAKDLFNLFFKSRVRNLFIALLATFVFWVVFRQIFSRIQKTTRFSREEKSFRIRLFNVAFLFFTGIGAVLVFVVVLFVLHDWVLLTLGIMVLIGIAWSSKQALPKFWGQAAVLLNMGPVREGERVIYNGIPWRVRSLNFYSHLVNDDLDGGVIRLPIQEMPGLRSRRSSRDEPWFPTKKNDWMILADGTYGKVVCQGPESVVVQLLGGGRKTYRTENFLAQDPTVLSVGFRHRITFGVDYQHQANVTEEIPEVLERELCEGLRERGFESKLKSLKVEFDEAAGSSLNLAVIANFSGEAGAEYEALTRLIQRLCVDSCNRHGWVIPFEQLTMHVASVPQADAQKG